MRITRLLRFTGLVGFTLGCLVCVGCGPAASVDPLPFAAASASAAPDPSKMGPYAVGVRTVVFEDTTRPKADGSPRRLVTEIWYPATQATRGQPGVTYDIREEFTAEQQAAIGDAVPVLQTSAVRDAPVAATHGPFPLVVFSHGQAAIRWQSTYYTVLLASHGYVVVSTDHEGGTLADVVRGQLQNVLIGLETRPVDVRYLISRFSRLASTDPLFGLIDLERVGVTGHSFGAISSLRVAAIDPRVKAIVPQAPYDATSIWADLPQPVVLHIPVQVQGGGDDKTLPYDPHVTSTWAALNRPRWLVNIVHGGHFTFSDLCALDLASIADRVKLDIPGANIRKVLEDGCGPSAPPASLAQPLIDHFAVGFFNGTLKGSKASLDLLTQEQAEALAPGVATITSEP